MAKGVKGSTPIGDTKRERTSFNIKGQNSKKLRIIAANTLSDMSTIVDGLIDGFIKDYEKKNGAIVLP